MNGDRKLAGSCTGRPFNVTLASVGAPSWTWRLPETGTDCDAPDAIVPVHTTLPVEGSVAITQHDAEAWTATV